MPRARFATALAAALCSRSPGRPWAAETEDCAQSSHPAGEWPTYGADLRNTRSQPKEKVIGAKTAGSLKPSFTYRAPG